MHVGGELQRLQVLCDTILPADRRGLKRSGGYLPSGLFQTRICQVVQAFELCTPMTAEPQMNQ